MAHLGYKTKAFKEYKREQEAVKIWKIEQKAKKKRRKRTVKRIKNIIGTVLYSLSIIVVAFLLYFLVSMPHVEADTKKFGEGPFVMAVSYTESYDDLQYISNFPTCIEAEKYYYANCSQATIMMCQAEERMYMPVDHNSENTFSSFDFEVDDSQSCGFVKTQAGYSTFVENE